MTSLRIAFAGTPDFAAAHLQALIDSPHQIVAVLTQPDRPAGRGKKLLPSAVKVLAEQHQLPVHQPLNFKLEENWQQLREMDIDLLVVVAYGLLLPTAVLQWPRLGCINVHGSLLPRWRGAAPIQRAIWAGDAHSGVAIMQMDEGLDTGAVILTQRCDIDAAETSASLYQKLAALGPQALIEAVSQLAEGRAVAVQQPEDGVTYAQKLSKQEALLDWQDATQLCRNVRAFNPWPMVWFNLNEQPVKVWQASVVADNQGRAAGTIIQADKHGIVVACAQQAIRLEVLQFAGKNPLSAAEVLNGRAEFFSVGTTL